MRTTGTTDSEILFYPAADGLAQVDVRLEDETVWLTQAQLVTLFESSRSNIVEHIPNIYREGELSESSTCRDLRQVRQEGARTVRRSIPHYNLDMIIPVGYRAKSTTATKFRMWATERIKEYLVQGAAINDRRLEQLGLVVEILQRSEDDVLSGVAEVLSHYLPSLQLLQRYDEQTLLPPEGTVPSGHRRYDLSNFCWSRPLCERRRKAANLLYLVIKDHPLADGNKRSAAALFVTFLSKNGLLTGSQGQVRISNNALAAVTLMLSISKPQEKELMITLVMNMLAQ